MTREQELLQSDQNWNQAIEQNRVTEIEKFISKDWIIVGSSGITPRERFLESIQSGELSHSRMDSDETQVRVYENTGVVTSRGTSAGKYKGQDFELYEWSASTYIYKNGNWICVHTMLTAANQS